MLTIASLKIGQHAIIKDISIDVVPLKLLEMGCLPGNEVSLIHIAPLKDPLFIDINGCHMAIRKEMAKLIEVELIS
jgi:ferrous iron transport protein A